MATSQARLSPLGGSVARLVLVAAAVAAWGSLHPAALHSASGGMQPWIRLSVVEALAALLLAAGAAHVAGWLVVASLRLLQWALPAQPPRHAKLLSWLGMLAAVSSSLLHPAVPAYLGCLCLAARLVAAHKRVPAADSHHGCLKAAVNWPPQVLAWLVFYSQLALLPTLSLVAWLLGGMRRLGVGWHETDSLLLAALALHACLRSWQDNPASSNASLKWQRSAQLVVQAAAHETAACTAAAASLWGHPHIVLYAACVSAAADCSFGRSVGKWEAAQGTTSSCTSG